MLSFVPLALTAKMQKNLRELPCKIVVNSPGANIHFRILQSLTSRVIEN